MSSLMEMDGDKELLITIPVTIISIIFTVLNAAITIYLIRSFLKSPKKQDNAKNNSNSNLSTTTQTTKENTSTRTRSGSHTRSCDQQQPAKTMPGVEIKRYFKYTASITVVFNTLNSLFNTISCFYIVLDPQFDDHGLYIYHPSHIHRIMSTVCWYVAQVSLIYVFTGRLYYCFHGSALAVSKKSFIWINAINTFVVIIGLLSGYYGVFQGNKILAEIGLNLIGRIMYQIISYVVLYMFSKRLLLLSVQENACLMQKNTSKSKIETHKEPELPAKPTLTKKPSLKNNQSLSISLVSNIKQSKINSIKNAGQTVVQKKPENATEITVKTETRSRSKSIEAAHQQQLHSFFLAITTRNAILMLTVSMTVLLVTFCFFGFRFVFGEQTRLTLLIPMNMAAFDSVNTSICVLCLFYSGNKIYDKLYGKCDIRCRQICLQIAQETLLA